MNTTPAPKLKRARKCIGCISLHWDDSCELGYLNTKSAKLYGSPSPSGPCPKPRTHAEAAEWEKKTP